LRSECGTVALLKWCINSIPKVWSKAKVIAVDKPGKDLNLAGSSQLSPNLPP